VPARRPSLPARPPLCIDTLAASRNNPALFLFFAAVLAARIVLRQTAALVLGGCKQFGRSTLRFSAFGFHLLFLGALRKHCATMSREICAVSKLPMQNFCASAARRGVVGMLDFLRFHSFDCSALIQRQRRRFNINAFRRANGRQQRQPNQSTTQQ
jgi:hypothetical protein